jgi:hypothetical protein
MFLFVHDDLQCSVKRNLERSNTIGEQSETGREFTKKIKNENKNKKKKKNTTTTRENKNKNKCISAHSAEDNRNKSNKGDAAPPPLKTTVGLILLFGYWPNKPGKRKTQPQHSGQHSPNKKTSSCTQ